MADKQPTNPSTTNTKNNDQDEEMIQRQQTETQLQNIQNEIRNTQSLTSEMMPLSYLTASFQQQEENTTCFKEESQQLEAKYKSLRKVRGDGNCYYRAFLYAVCENVLLLLLNEEVEGRKKEEGVDELNRLVDLAKNSINLVTQRGYDRSTIEMFYEELVDLFTSLSPSSSSSSSQEQLTQSTLHTTLNEENAMSDYCTWYLRLLTACHLKSDPDRFIHFLDVEDCSGGGAGAVGMDVPTFCSREVEPMGRECGMVQVLALAEVMGVRVVIEYMDGRGGSGLVCHEFGPEDAMMKIFLLYRPGHYDILYK